MIMVGIGRRMPTCKYVSKMSKATPKMRDFAERLLAYDAKGKTSPKAKSQMAALVNERLRPHLATLMGGVGFRALLSRALVLAKAEIPWLRAAHVNVDGSLEGLDELAAHVGPDEFPKGCVVLLAQFLGLLVTFIGEELTLRLVRERWPKLPLNEFDFRKGDER